MTDIAFTAPHQGATDIAQRFLREGASAIDAMIAASAAISVLYPHMNSLGGDGFWLIHQPGYAPIAIDACGSSAGLADIDWYRKQGHEQIPARGGAAALCLGGTTDGWRVARELSASRGATSLPLNDLLAPAVELARTGIEVTESLQMASEKVQPQLAGAAGYQSIFCPEGRTLVAGEQLRNPGLADFLEILADQGTESLFRGELAKNLANWLESSGSPLRLSDFQQYRAQLVEPLSIAIAGVSGAGIGQNRGAQIFNLPAPTQGVASLLILAIYDYLVQNRMPGDEADHVHYLVEATKQAFLVRDREVTDPSRLSAIWPQLLSRNSISECAERVNMDAAMPWPKVAEPGDTVWMGALDSQGCMVSFIQSVYWEFGSGLVHPDYGLVWNNRGMNFSLDSNHRNSLAPGIKPFHTLNPAFALFDDGRRMAYGTMGGEGQPQTQAALFARHLYQGYSLEESIARGRWLLGRTWGDQSQDLKLEQDLYSLIGEQLEARGHDISQVPAKSELMGHAGAICCHPDGSADAATDPRSDGRAIREPF